jgi:hypothetical protein
MADKAPVSKVEIYPIAAAIWKNEGSKGTWYSVTIQRTYKQGDEYKRSDSFGVEDLLTVAKVADLAHTEIVNFEKDDHAAKKTAAGSQSEPE